MIIKKEIRVLGIDDGYFRRGIDKETYLIGAITRGYIRLEGVLSEKITVDGNDSTEKIIKLVTKSSHYHQIRVIMTNGISFAGFNIFNPIEVYEHTKLPIVIVIRKKPDIKEFLNAASKANRDIKYIVEILNKIGYPKPVRTRYGITYYQNVGINNTTTEQLIKMLAKYSRIPEPVRIAHMIAMGVTLGYSRGRP